MIVPLCVLAMALERQREAWVFLPFRYFKWWIIFPASLAETVAHANSLESRGAFYGVAFYCLGCASLLERKAWYRPSRLWDGGVHTFRRFDRPIAYWLLVGVTFAFSLLCLVGGSFNIGG